MHAHKNEWLFHKVIVLQIIKAPFYNLTRPSLDAFCLFGLISRACPVKPRICNNMKNVAIFSFTNNSSSSTLHLRYEWDPRTKVIACAARVMCAKEFVIEKGLIFHIVANTGVLFFGDDETRSADESKETKRAQGWSRQIIRGGFYYLQFSGRRLM